MNGKDPEGIARRDPSSMCAHQKQWPKSCQGSVHLRQSPIALSSESFSAKSSVPIQVVFSGADATLVDVGHTFQIRFVKSGGSLAFEGESYSLKQFHFHKPAEYVLDGKQFDMEAHFVFVSAGNGAQMVPKVFALGYPIQRGLENRELSKAWAYLPPVKEGYGEENADGFDWQKTMESSEIHTDVLAHGENELKSGMKLNMAEVIPISSKSGFYIYEGSLTTPGCDENVTHAFSASPIYMSDSQMEHFEGYYEGNNREIQAVGNSSARRFRTGFWAGQIESK